MPSVRKAHVFFDFHNQKRRITLFFPPKLSARQFFDSLRGRDFQKKSLPLCLSGPFSDGTIVSSLTLLHKFELSRNTAFFSEVVRCSFPRPDGRRLFGRPAFAFRISAMPRSAPSYRKAGFFRPESARRRSAHSRPARSPCR